MEEATENQKEEQEIEEEVQRVAKENELDTKTVEMYRTVFGILDLDGGGSIEEDELKIGLDAINRKPSDEELKEMLLEVDESGDGEVDFAEFLQFMMVVKARQKTNSSGEGKGEGKGKGKGKGKRKGEGEGKTRLEKPADEAFVDKYIQQEKKKVGGER